MSKQDKATPLERIQGFQKQINETLPELKMQLATELQQAADTYKAIIAFGSQELWNDPQYKQPLQDLALTPTADYDLAVLLLHEPKRKSKKGTRAPIAPTACSH